MNEGLLAQFWLTKEQIDHVEGRTRDNDDNDVADKDPEQE